MEEREAVARLKRGDIGGLEALVRTYQVQAIRSAYLITRDRALAEDTVQAAFLRAYERIAQFDAARPFGPWFLRSVVNDAVKAARRGQRLSRWRAREPGRHRWRTLQGTLCWREGASAGTISGREEPLELNGGLSPDVAGLFAPQFENVRAFPLPRGQGGLIGVVQERPVCISNLIELWTPGSIWKKRGPRPRQAALDLAANLVDNFATASAMRSRAARPPGNTARY